MDIVTSETEPIPVSPSYHFCWVVLNQPHLKVLSCRSP